MNYRERLSRPDDYIDRARDGFGWGPIVLGIAFITMLGLLLFVPSGRSGRASNNPQTEMTAPAPSFQIPVSPNPK